MRVAFLVLIGIIAVAVVGGVCFALPSGVTQQMKAGLSKGNTTVIGFAGVSTQSREALGEGLSDPKPNRLKP